jgi:predicted PurR-regulated permease PerM
LFLITDIILTVGLYLLGVNNAILLSLVFSVADIFPVLSVGIFIIPWAAFAIFNGKTYLAIGLIALFLIITILRNIIEPKLIGKNIGLHPLMTLASMYIGLRINGLLLSLIMPFIFILVKYLNECGIIFIYKTSKNNNENLL